MGKRSKKTKVRPLWKGIGCLFLFRGLGRGGIALPRLLAALRAVLSLLFVPHFPHSQKETAAAAAAVAAATMVASQGGAEEQPQPAQVSLQTPRSRSPTLNNTFTAFDTPTVNVCVHCVRQKKRTRATAAAQEEPEEPVPSPKKVGEPVHSGELWE